MATLKERLEKVVAEHGALIETKNGLVEQIQGVEQQLLILQGKAIVLQELSAEADKADATDDAPTAE